MIITNDEELENFLLLCADDLIQFIKEKIEALLRQHIWEDIYMSGEPNQYERTYQFLNSVDDSGIAYSEKGYKTEIFHNPELMDSDPANFIHGSLVFEGGTDARKWLPELFNEGKVGLLFGVGYWTFARPYWDNAIQEIENENLLFEWTQQFLSTMDIELV